MRWEYKEMGLGLEQIVLYVRFIVVLRGSEGEVNREGVILVEDVDIMVVASTAQLVSLAH